MTLGKTVAERAVRAMCPARAPGCHSPENEGAPCPAAQHVPGVEGNLANHSELLG